jgi:hypothetical protein
MDKAGDMASVRAMPMHVTVKESKAAADFDAAILVFVPSFI